MSGSVTSFSDCTILLPQLQSLEAIGKVICILQIGGKRVWLHATHTGQVVYIRIMCLDDPSVLLDEGTCFSQKRIKAADEVITPSVATIQLNFASRTGQGKSF